MAQRPVFLTMDKRPYFRENYIDFEYFNGFSESQKRRSIESLHSAFFAIQPDARVLEISTKSPDSVGVALSAFNLKMLLSTGQECSLESAFQASKVFASGGPYNDLLLCAPWVAKKDPRLMNSGEIIAFQFDGVQFPTEPKTFFYDWLYVNTVNHNAALKELILGYNAFTDIEFNPKRSLNCQARSAAIIVSLSLCDLLDQALISPESFLTIVYNETEIIQKQVGQQLSLF